MSDPFLLVLMSLAAYRLWRLLAVDELPPFMWLREKFTAAVERRFGAAWSLGVSCPWCSGAHISFLTVWVTTWFTSVPLPVLQAGAVSVVVGLIAQWENL